MEASTIASLAAGVQIVLATVLAGVAFRAWTRARSARFAYLAGALVAFWVHGALLAVGLHAWGARLEDVIAPALVLEAAALLLLYLGVLRR